MNVITSESGAIEQEMSFDAWGNRRNPNTWQNLTSTPTNLITDRGFTGHEHLDGFKLINMNGRVYDPVLGRFLSADKIIQNPVGTQSYNRYSYCINNPLMFTDPSGYTYFKYKDGEWSSFEYDPFGGTTSYDFRTASGGGLRQPMYNHLGGGVYTNRDGYRVSFDEVNNNYLARDLKGTLSGEGALEAAKAILNGFDLYEVSAYGRTTHVLTPGGPQYGIDHFLNSLEGYSSSNVLSVGGTTIYDLVIDDVDGVYAVSNFGNSFLGMLPVAQTGALDIDLIVGIGADINLIGGGIIYKGRDAGKTFVYSDGGGVFETFGVNISVGVETYVWYYTGNIGNFSIETFNGKRREIEVGFATSGTGITWTVPDKFGGRLIGIKYEKGTPSPISIYGITINYSYGETIVH